MGHSRREARAGVLAILSVAAGMAGTADAFCAQVATRTPAPPGQGVAPSGLIVLTDIFGRDVTHFGLVLVDWEGYLANPAIELFLHPPATAAYPATATLTANGARLYFDAPPQGGQVGPGGPTRTLALNDAAPVSLRLSIFPDRDSTDEQYTLTIDVVDGLGQHATSRVPVHVLDQDVGSPVVHDVYVDYSEDAGGFFLDPLKAAILEQAADDWAYFIADMSLDTVPAGAQSTWIWNFPDAFSLPGNGHYTTNTAAYTGFLLYTYGIDTPLLRSGGESSLCCLQSSGGITLPLRRSGGVEMEIKGNYNQLGWFLTTGDDDWHVSRNLGNEPNDFYSIAHHELGHALAFHSGYPSFAAAESAGGFTDAAVVDYYGAPVPVDGPVDHFTGVVDPASLRGIFGNEYHGSVPARRWLITKLDLLLLQAVGYTLRPTSSLAELAVPPPSLVAGFVGVPYADEVEATGGIPFYDWTLDSGQLPPGLGLDRFTGAITGTPTAAGVFPFTVRVRDYTGGPGVVASVSITVS